MRGLIFFIIASAVVSVFGCETELARSEVDSGLVSMSDALRDPAVDTAVHLQRCEPIAFADVFAAGACSFYHCADEVLGCGPEEYLIDFACRYADRYLAETYSEMSDAGRSFLESVFVCLQTSLQAEFDALSDCDSVASLGFASHVPCYLEGGFCELPLEDKLLVFAAIDPEDLEHPLQRSARQEVIDRCSER